ncbi:MinD/ParA family protein [Corallococcus sp. CA054B]|uniref:CobQ/CobB/MinD/ParA nucleotide binding domain-containing protein n=1 Tax=Corallococcus coralloides (strain ATCC 25202 / DSM 2259 / NBRC 100086 / M2) TaxID=1144275 RepID=H8MGF3_CORCM|nr:CobQ/CobB/MinD/ParA nucleotide binding domain-containing protein [Corallococcus coralloides DSM 2259]RKG64830.1 MinD/ParA family protein [Corallococcus sp. CA054B]
MRAFVKPAPLPPSAPASLAGTSPRAGNDVSPSGPAGLARRSRAARIIAVGGGKGGIGKSMVSANLGVALAQAGQKVLLVDADLGGANLHTCLGVGPPESTLSDFLRRGKANLEEVMVGTGVPGLSLIAGAQDSLDAANLKYAQKQKLLRTLLSQTTADYLILDLGAGTSFNTLDFFLIADHGLLVVLPEPTSVENAYRFVKAAFFRKLQQTEARYGIQDMVEGALSTREGGLRTLHDIVAQVRRKAPSDAERLERELAAFHVRLVVNQARTDADEKVGSAMVSAWKKFFGIDMDDLGALRHDDEAWRAVRKRKPVLLERPDSPVSQGLQRIAARILTLDGLSPESAIP